MYLVCIIANNGDKCIYFWFIHLGEAVLNLSQGTVSEILSKPRPWPALSVKGREPYIRMYTWFHDTDNVQKLLAWKQERDGITKYSLFVNLIFFNCSFTTYYSSCNNNNKT